MVMAQLREAVASRPRSALGTGATGAGCNMTADRYARAIGQE